jgi:lipopolysaccharide export system protein LptA
MVDICIVEKPGLGWQRSFMKNFAIRAAAKAAFVSSVVLSSMALLATPSLAQSFAEAFGGFSKPGNTPISIDANTLDILSESGTATFEGAVRVVQNDTVLTAQRLVVSYSGSALTEPSAIKKLTASGSLQVKTGGRSAKADRGTFDLQSNQVVLTGNVRVAEGTNVATGCRLTVNLNSGNAQLQSSNCGGASSGGRVQLRLTPNSN